MRRAKHFADATLATPPGSFKVASGWTRYGNDGSIMSVAYPLESEIAFDVETLYKESQFPVLATAASSEAWYAWVSPWILSETSSPRHLIPMGPDPRLIIGHNVGYDRARIKEEYKFFQPTNYFLDTMSLHVAVSGMCNAQRPLFNRWTKNKKIVEANIDIPNLEMPDDGNTDWISQTSLQSLCDLAKFYCDIKLDKSLRDFFGELDRDGVLNMIQDLLSYCARDVHATHSVYSKTLTSFIRSSPHPVTAGAIVKLGGLLLPTTKKWNSFIERAENLYHQNTSKAERLLHELALNAVALKDQPEAWKSDEWLKHLDWTVKPIKYVKDKKTGEERLAKGQKLPGYPQWFKDLSQPKDGPLNLTLRTRAAPYLLKLSWEGNPLRWSDEHGWCFVIKDHSKLDDYLAKQYVIASDNGHEVLMKVPHKDGPMARCVQPIGKNYLNSFEVGQIASMYPTAKEIIEINSSCSYWVGVRERLQQQLIVWDDDVRLDIPNAAGVGLILPQTIVMGTITRRAVEKTWLTASNAKKNRIGSELKAMIEAPEGYSFVGADVDSEELWIASLVGDSQFGVHGATALGWMTLEGSKSAGTDLHSQSAKILGVSRNDAKVFNYGRIYGAGVQFTARLLQQKNPKLSDVEAKKVASILYANTKGRKIKSPYIHPSPFWAGGTESYVFNKLEALATASDPRTPVLEAALTLALKSKSVGDKFMTSRTNWAIQSSGVDYLHLLVMSMDYLIRTYNLQARLAIAIHDEIRFLSADSDRYRVAMALQISNLWVRSIFSQKLGIDDVPQSCAFFSSVDIDKVLRKEVDMDCVTPSNPTPIPPGESLDINQLLANPEARLEDLSAPRPLDRVQHQAPDITPIIQEGGKHLIYLRLQSAASTAEMKKILACSSGSMSPTDRSDSARRVEKQYYSYRSDAKDHIKSQIGRSGN